jgi:hypothetical protein
LGGMTAIVPPPTPAWRPAAKARIRIGHDANVFPPVVGAAEGAHIPHHFDGRLAPGEDLVPGGAVGGKGEVRQQEACCKLSES